MLFPNKEKSRNIIFKMVAIAISIKKLRILKCVFHFNNSYCVFTSLNSGMFLHLIILALRLMMSFPDNVSKSTY